MKHARDHYEDGWDSITETKSLGDIAEIIKEEGATTPRNAVKAVGEYAKIWHDQFTDVRGYGGMSTPKFKMALSDVPTKKAWLEEEERRAVPPKVRADERRARKKEEADYDKSLQQKRAKNLFGK